MPFVSASLTCEVGSPIIASIELVPLQVIKFIRPRTQVHLMVTDTLAFGDLEPRFAFEGEVIGRGMAKSQNSRQFSVTAADYSAYWDEAKAYYYNANFLVGKVEQSPYNGGTTPGTESAAASARLLQTTSTIRAYMCDTIVQILNSSQSNNDLVAGIVQIIKSLADTNIFYRSAYDRLRINDRLRVFTGGNLKDFLKDISMDDFLTSFTGAQGGFISLREMLLSLMQMVFHDYVTVPFPSKVDLKTTATSQSTYKVKSGDTLNQIASKFGTTSEAFVKINKIITDVNAIIAGTTLTVPPPNTLKQKTLGQFLFVPDGYTLPAPKCNVIFPNQIQSFQFTDDFRAAPTRYMFRPSHPEWLTKETNVVTYPIMFYPTSFANYMFKKSSPEIAKQNLVQSQDTSTQFSFGNPNSLLGAGKLFTGVKGKTYSDVFYGEKSTTAVGGVSIFPSLREIDFLTNDESLRGIFFDTDTFAPSVTALAKGTTPAARNKFFNEIGAYLYFKKRFASRSAHASLQFCPFMVPGFNAVLLDDSEAGQSVIAKVQRIVHTLTHEACYTHLDLGYARDFDEVDALTGGTGEPPIPAWFDTEIFGKPDPALIRGETTYLNSEGAISKDEIKARNSVTSAIAFPSVSRFYQYLLACDAITDYGVVPNIPSATASKLVTPRGAISWLVAKYRKVSSDDVLRDTFVREYTKRPVATMSEAMFFVGAMPVGAKTSGDGQITNGVIPDEFASFQAIPTGNSMGRFDGGVGSQVYPDQNILKIRREIIDKYVTELKTRTGFRG